MAHPVKTRHSRVQKRIRTWLNMADCVRRMARWKSFCGAGAGGSSWDLHGAQGPPLAGTWGCWGVLHSQRPALPAAPILQLGREAATGLV